MNKSLHPLMLARTGSGVGKNVITVTFCRIFLQNGYHPAPFKAQNMALNSYATPEELEIGRTQAVQIGAAGMPCHTDVNPLLLKPSSDHTPQMTLNGRSIGNRNTYEYFRREGREELRKEVHATFNRLAARYNPVIMERAGSISGINLRDNDLVNLPMAMHAGADVTLVADTDHGGVFASVCGSMILLRPEERRHVRGILINKFRRDIRLFESGIEVLEDLCGVPVAGVVPYYKDIYIEEEDSMILQTKNIHTGQRKINTTVMLFRHLSNFTDFNVLKRDPRVHLFYTNNTGEPMKTDIILLPGSKSTLSDLYELRRDGVVQTIVRAHRGNATVIGICRGYRLMRQGACGPDHVEGEIERLSGLGLLSVSTRMQGEKITRQIRLHSLEGNEACEEYEIHMGTTTPLANAPASPLNHLTDGRENRYFADRICMGTYVYGIFDNPSVIDYLLEPFADKLKETTFDYKAFKGEQYDKLAAHVRKHIDLPLIYQMLTDND